MVDMKVLAMRMVLRVSAPRTPEGLITLESNVKHPKLLLNLHRDTSVGGYMELNIANTLQRLLDENRGEKSRQQYIIAVLKVLRDHPNTLAEISAILKANTDDATKERGKL